MSTLSSHMNREQYEELRRRRAAQRDSTAQSTAQQDAPDNQTDNQPDNQNAPVAPETGTDSQRDNGLSADLSGSTAPATSPSTAQQDPRQHFGREELEQVRAAEQAAQQAEAERQANIKAIASRPMPKPGWFETLGSMIPGGMAKPASQADNSAPTPVQTTPPVVQGTTPAAPQAAQQPLTKPDVPHGTSAAGAGVMPPDPITPALQTAQAAKARQEALRASSRPIEVSTKQQDPFRLGDDDRPTSTLTGGKVGPDTRLLSREGVIQSRAGDMYETPKARQALQEAAEALKGTPGEQYLTRRLNTAVGAEAGPAFVGTHVKPAPLTFEDQIKPEYAHLGEDEVRRRVQEETRLMAAAGGGAPMSGGEVYRNYYKDPVTIKNDQYANAIKSIVRDGLGNDWTKLDNMSPESKRAMFDAGLMNTGRAELAGDWERGAADVGRELLDDPGKLIPFVAGVKDLTSAAGLYAAAKRLEGGTATDADLDLIEGMLARAQVAALSSDTFGGKVADVLAQLPAFAGEFAATGGVYTAGRAMGTKAATGFLKKYAETRAGRLAVGAASRGAGVLAQTAVASAPRIAADFTGKVTPGFVRQQDGSVKVDPNSAMKWYEAAYKSLASAVIEVGSERSGGLLGKFFKSRAKLLLPKTTDSLNKMKLAIGRYVAINPNVTMADTWETIARHTGWHGPLEEFGEERVGDIMRAIFTGEVNMPDTQQYLSELAAFAAPTGARTAIDTVLNNIRVRPASMTTEERDAADRIILNNFVGGEGLNEDEQRVRDDEQLGEARQAAQTDRVSDLGDAARFEDQAPPTTDTTDTTPETDEPPATDDAGVPLGSPIPQTVRETGLEPNAPAIEYMGPGKGWPRVDDPKPGDRVGGKGLTGGVVKRVWRTATAKEPDGELHLTITHDDGKDVGVSGREAMKYRVEADAPTATTEVEAATTPVVGDTVSYTRAGETLTGTVEKVFDNSLAVRVGKKLKRVRHDQLVAEQAPKESTAPAPDDSAVAGQPVAAEPTEAQKEAGNYKKGHVKLDGYDITVENPVGSERSGTDGDGKAWRQTMKADYGYIRGTVGYDKDHLDTFIKPGHTGGGNVYVVNQVNPKTGKFDEHKVVMGAASADEAMQIYNANYQKGWTGGKSVVEMTPRQFNAWAYDAGKKGPKGGEVKQAGPESYTPEKKKYVDAAMGNLRKSSRTVAGVLDTSASKGKADQIAATADEAAVKAVQNFETTIARLYDEKDATFGNWRAVVEFMDQINRDVNRGIVKEGVLERTEDSDKFTYTSVDKLDMARRAFGGELIARLKEGDAIETAAWIHWRVNFTDHFYADGVGKTAEALADWVLMRAGIPLPEMPANRKEWFGYASVKHRDPAHPASYYSRGYDRFSAYFRGLIPGHGNVIRDSRLADIRRPTDRFGLPITPFTLPPDHPLAKPTGREDADGNYIQVAGDATLDATDEIVLRGILPAGTYTRDEIHDAIEEHFYNQSLELDTPTIWFTGGGSGAGKSTTVGLLKSVGDVPKEILELNADDYKSLIPEYKRIVEAGDGRAAALVHEESSYLMKRLRDRLLADRRSFILDATLANYKKIEKLVNQVRARGYETHLIGVTVDPYEAVTRAAARANMPVHQGGGRYVPLRSVLESHRGFNAGIDKYLELFDNATIYDNTLNKPVNIAEKTDGEIVTLDAQAMGVVKSRGGLNVYAESRKELIRSYDPVSESVERQSRYTVHAQDVATPEGSEGEGAAERGRGDRGEEQGAGGTGQEDVSEPVAEGGRAGGTRTTGGLTYKPRRGLNAEQRRVESELGDILGQSDDIVDDLYDALPDSMDGKVIGTDIVRFLSPDYQTPEQALQFTQATAAPSSAWRKQRYRREILSPGPDGRKLLASAGGPGAGKSSGMSIRTIAEAAVVLDTTQPTIGEIELALDNGWGVVVHYTYRDVPNAVPDVADRGVKTGRIYPMLNLLKEHREAQQNMIDLIERFKNDSRVQFRLRRNHKMDGEYRAKPIDTVDILPGGRHNITEGNADEQREQVIEAYERWRSERETPPPARFREIAEDGFGQGQVGGPDAQADPARAEQEADAQPDDRLTARDAIAKAMMEAMGVAASGIPANNNVTGPVGANNAEPQSLLGSEKMPIDQLRARIEELRKIADKSRKAILMADLGPAGDDIHRQNTSRLRFQEAILANREHKPFGIGDLIYVPAFRNVQRVVSITERTPPTKAQQKQAAQLRKRANVARDAGYDMAMNDKGAIDRNERKARQYELEADKRTDNRRVVLKDVDNEGVRDVPLVELVASTGRRPAEAAAVPAPAGESKPATPAKQTAKTRQKRANNKPKNIKDAAEDARQALRDEVDDFAKKFGNRFGSTQFMDPELLAHVGRIVGKSVKAGLYTFAEAMENLYQMLRASVGDDQARKIMEGISEPLEGAWEVARAHNPRMTAAGRVADHLPAAEAPKPAPVITEKTWHPVHAKRMSGPDTQTGDLPVLATKVVVGNALDQMRELVETGGAGNVQRAVELVLPLFKTINDVEVHPDTLGWFEDRLTDAATDLLHLTHNGAIIVRTPKGGNDEGDRGRSGVEDAGGQDAGAGPVDVGGGTGQAPTGGIPGRGTGVRGGDAGGPGGNRPAVGGDTVAGGAGVSGAAAQAPGEGVGGGAVAGGQQGDAGRVDSDRDLNPSAYTIKPTDTFSVSSKTEAWRNNIEAIKTLNRLRETGGKATDEDKAALLKFTGWGWSPGHFFDERNNPDFKYHDKEFAEKHGEKYKTLKALMTPTEFEAAKASLQNSHYTRPDVIAAMWQAAERLGFEGGTVLEPSAGVGHFFGVMPKKLRSKSSLIGVELDPIPAEIMRHLYPEAEVHADGFQNVPLRNNSVDLMISNVPFGAVKVPGARDYKDAFIHDYFAVRSIDKLKPGGLAIFVTSDGTMDKRKGGGNFNIRNRLRERADLIGAIRLPSNTFKDNAGTEVTTDILIFRKKEGKKPHEKSEPFYDLTQIGTDTVTLTTGGKKYEYPGVPIVVNEYFARNPDMMLGTPSMNGKLHGKGPEGQFTLDPVPGADLSKQLAAAIKRLPEKVFSPQEVKVEGAVGEEVPGALELSYQIRDGKPYQVIDGKLTEPEWLHQKNFGTNYTQGLKPQEVKERIQVANDWVALRDATKELMTLENDSKSTNKSLLPKRKALAKRYKAYVKKYGTLTRSSDQQHNEKARFLFDDPDYYGLQGLLEDQKTTMDKKTGRTVYEFVPSDLQHKRVRRPMELPKKADTIDEAIDLALGWRAGLDADFIGNLLGITSDEAVRQITESGRGFLDPVSGELETRTKYLSGNVREKLERAKEAAAEDPAYLPNIEALEKVQPEPVTVSGIYFRLGSRWMPDRVYSQFATELLGSPVKVTYNPASNGYDIEIDDDKTDLNRVTWGTRRTRTTVGGGTRVNETPGHSLLAHALQGTEPIVTMSVDIPGGGTHSVKDKEGTRANEDMIRKMHEAFIRWGRTSDTPIVYRGEPVPAFRVIEDEYNRVNNAFREPHYDGSHIKRLPGASDYLFYPEFRTRMIARAMEEGAGMIAHGVGSGKTLTMAAIAMEYRRLGLAKKPMIVVQKSTIGQFAGEFKKAFPDARLIVADEKSFSAQNRQRLFGRIAVGDYDAIIVTQPQFERIQSKPEFIERHLKGVLKDYEEAIRAEEEKQKAAGERKKSRTQKQLEAAKQSLEARLQSAIDAAKSGQDKNSLFFEDLGVDLLFIDEAHAYKNAPVISRMSRIKGIPSQFSNKAITTEIKLSSIQGPRNGRGVFLATGTPLVNTMAEAYTMLRLATPYVLERYGINNFDAFAHTFGKVHAGMEFSWSGTFQRVERFARFVNGPELITMIRSGFDVAMGNKEIGLKVPRMRGGDKPRLLKINDPQSEPMRRWLLTIAQMYQNADPAVKYDFSWVPITLMQAGTYAAADPRLIDPEAAPGKKVLTAVKNIKRIWEKSKKTKGTQIVFLDRFSPFTKGVERLNEFVAGGDHVGGQQDDGEAAEVDLSDLDISTIEEETEDDADGEETETKSEIAKFEEEEYKSAKFNLYHDIRDRLIESGIPATEIAIVHDANTDRQREEMFEKVRNGQVRVILGSTEKLGIGVSIQQKVVAMHHIDPPRSMTPAMNEQRNGRGIRQGNENEWISNFMYGLVKSMDTGIYAMLERKSRFISQALMARGVGREFDDAADEDAANMARMVAELTGDPLPLIHAELKAEVDDLRSGRDAFESGRTDRSRQLDDLTRQHRQYTAAAEPAEADKTELQRDFQTGDDAVWKLEVGNKVVADNRKDVATGLGEIIRRVEAEAERNAAERLNTKTSKHGSASVTVRLNGHDLTINHHAVLDPNTNQRVGSAVQSTGYNLFASRPGESGRSIARSGEVSTGAGLLNSITMTARNAKGAEHYTAIADSLLPTIRSVQESLRETWDHYDELAEKERRLKVIEYMLERGMTGVPAEGTVQRRGGMEGEPRDTRRPVDILSPQPLGPRPESLNDGIKMFGAGLPFGKMLDDLFRSRKGSDLFDEAKEGSPAIRSDDPEVEKRWRAAKGIGKEGMHKTLKRSTGELFQSFRRHFEHLDPKKDTTHAVVADLLRQYEASPNWAKAVAFDNVRDVTDKLGPKKVDLFTRLVVLPDILKDVEDGLYNEKELPFGYANVQAVRDDLAKFQKQAEGQADIQRAMEKRKWLASSITNRLVELDLLPASVLEDDRYYHRQVLKYVRDREAAYMGTSSQDVRIKQKGFQKARVGGTDFNTVYHEAEVEWMAQGLALIARRETLERVKAAADIAPALKREAKHLNMVAVYATAGEPAFDFDSVYEEVRELRRKLRDRDYAGMTRKGIMARLNKIDVLAPFKQRIAMHKSHLEALAEAGNLDAPPRFAAEVAALSSRDEDTGNFFGLLNWLSDQADHPGQLAALGLFKAIADREAFIKRTLGKDYLMWDDLLPEGYRKWQPEKGNQFFMAQTIDDRMLQQMLETGEVPANLEDMVRRVLVAGGPKAQWALPEGIAETLDNMGKDENLSKFGEVWIGTQASWKQWVLLNPVRAIKYNLNNISGDLDIALAYDPKILKDVYRAAKDLWDYQIAGKAKTAVRDEVQELMRMGVLDSGLTIHEIPDINKTGAFRALTETRPGPLAKAVQSYWQGSRGFTTWRENILRMAAYRYFKRRIDAGETNIYGASSVMQIDAITNPRDRAARLARDLVGDYGNVSAAGRYIRRRFIPFYSWVEVNTPRYARLMRNVKHEGGRGSGGRARVGAVVGFRAAKLGFKAHILYLAVMAFNEYMLSQLFPDPDERDEVRRVRQQTQRKPRIILGRRDDGTLIEARWEGALMDALEWFALEDYPQDIRDVVEGRWTLKDKLNEAAKSPPDRIVQSIEPFTKTLLESVTGRSAYPTIFEEGSSWGLRTSMIRDPKEHALRMWSLDGLYREVMNRPRRHKNLAMGIVESLTTYRTDPGEAAYFLIRSKGYQYKDRVLNKGGGGAPTERGNALYYHKKAVQWGDDDRAAYWLKRYEELGGTNKGYQQSMRMSQPLGMLAKADAPGFVASLSEKDRELLELAQSWYNEVYRPDAGQADDDPAEP